MTFNDISITSAMDWLAADQLFRAELQSINAEVQELIALKEKTMLQSERDSIQAQIDELTGVNGATNADGKPITADGVRAKIIKQYTDYQTKRREKLSK